MFSMIIPTHERHGVLYKQWQKNYFEDTINRHGESIQSMGKIYSRIGIKSHQRVVARESQWDDVKWRSKAVSKGN